MYKNIANNLEYLVTIIVGLLLGIDVLVFLVAVISMFSDGIGFPILVISIIVGVLIYVSGAFLLGFAELIKNSNKQTELLEEIKNNLINNKNIDQE